MDYNNLDLRDRLWQRLYSIWVTHTYTDIPADRPSGWTLDREPPPHFFGEPPKEYLPPYPAPSYWPNTSGGGSISRLSEAPPLFGSGSQFDNHTHALEDLPWPTWREFWGGNDPVWPPPYPPGMPNSPDATVPGGLPLWSPPMNPPMPPGTPPGISSGLPPDHVLPPPPGNPPLPPGILIPPLGPPMSASGGTLPGITFAPSRAVLGLEELCCIGFNPEESMLEAIISIRGTTGYGGNLCSKGGFESVGFWLIEPSRTLPPPYTMPGGWKGNAAPMHTMPGGQQAVRIFIGEARVGVYDIPRIVGNIQVGMQQISVGVLKYAVRLPLSPDMAQYVMQCVDIVAGSRSGSRLPILHAVLQFNRAVTDNNYGMGGVVWGGMMDADIQFPKKSQWGKWRLLERDTDPAKESQVFPVHVAHLKNRKILMFAGSGNVPYDRDPSTSGEGKGDPTPDYLDDSAALFDPDTDTLQRITPANYDTFCSGHSVMADGRVFVAGGTYEYRTKEGFHGDHFPGLKNVVLYDPDTPDLDAWIDIKYPDPDIPGNSLTEEMRQGRWYPGTLVLSDGWVLVMGGHTDEEDESRHENRDLEIFNPQAETHTEQWYFRGNGMPSTGNSIDPSHIGTYPRLHLLPNGNVFCSTYVDNYDDMIKYSAIWQPADYQSGNPAKPFGTWIKAPSVSDVRSKPIIEDHGYNSVLLPLLPDQNGAYSPQIMILPDTASYICNPETDSDWTMIQRALPIPKKRKYGNTVILPDATLMLVGGIDDKGDPALDRDAVLDVEMFDPVTRTWTIAAPISRPRNYHNIAILLYDGRVLIGCSNRDKADNKVQRELSLEIYTPDNLSRGPRPVFSVNPGFVKRGGQMKIRLGGGWHWSLLNVQQIGLIRLYSVTHAFGIDQRYVAVTGTPDGSGTEITVTIPSGTGSTKGLLPPGYYMVFLVSIAGAPSIGHIIHIE